MPVINFEKLHLFNGYMERRPLTFMQTATARFPSNCKLHPANCPSSINTSNKCFRKTAQGQLQKWKMKIPNFEKTKNEKMNWYET
jgi:hypothetical protein